jgi:hypothetical protein
MQPGESEFGGTMVRNDAPPARFGPIEIAFIRRYTHVLERVAQEASQEVLQDALAAQDDVGGLAGVLERVGATLPPPQPDPLAGARMRAVRIQRELLERAGGAYTTGQAAELLGVTPQAIHGRRTRGTLLALRGPNGDYLYPGFQFSTRGVLAGMAEVLAAFQVHDPWTQLSVLLSPAGQLGGFTPVQALLEGQVQQAIEAVAAYGEHVAG